MAVKKISKKIYLNSLIWFQGSCIGELKGVSIDTLSADVDFYCENEADVEITR